MRSALLSLVALLGPAAWAAGAPEPPADAVVAVLPFEADAGSNGVLVNLAPEGARPFVMRLDTGAAASVITPRMARELGVRVRAAKRTPYRRKTRLGRDLQFGVDSRTGDSGSRTGWEYGLLGSEFLDDYVLEIDFAARRVRFLDPERYEAPEHAGGAGEHVAPLSRTDSRVAVPVRVNGREFAALLDTGTPVTAVLSGKTARGLGIDVARLARFADVGGVLGPIETSLYEAEAFALAGAALGRVPLLVAPKGGYNQAGPNDSLIGYDVLAPFLIRIDYPRRRLWLKRVDPGPVRFCGGDYALAKRIGAFGSVVAGGWAVWAVVPGSPAEQRGVRAGDVIVSPSPAAAASSDEVLRRIEAGKELRVARRQGNAWVEAVLPGERAAE